MGRANDFQKCGRRVVRRLQGIHQPSPLPREFGGGPETRRRGLRNGGRRTQASGGYAGTDVAGAGSVRTRAFSTLKRKGTDVRATTVSRHAFHGASMQRVEEPRRTFNSRWTAHGFWRATRDDSLAAFDEGSPRSLELPNAGTFVPLDALIYLHPIPRGTPPLPRGTRNADGLRLLGYSPGPPIGRPGGCNAVPATRLRALRTEFDLAPQEIDITLQFGHACGSPVKLPGRCDLVWLFQANPSTL